MKNLIVIFFFLVSVSLFAQVEIKINDQVKIDRLYAGVLAGPEFSTDSLFADKYVTLRFGVMGTYQPVKWIALKSAVMYQVEPQRQPLSIIQYWMMINPIEKLSLEFGSMGTLATEQRPHPVSAGGQFETGTEALIAPGAINAKLKYSFDKDTKAGFGIATRANKPEYSGMIAYKQFKISAWYSEFNENLGVVATVNAKTFSSNLVYSNQIVSNNVNLNLSEDGTISFYADNGYNLSTKKIISGEYGLIKGFESSYIKGLFGIAHRYTTGEIVGYLFVHI